MRVYALSGWFPAEFFHLVERLAHTLHGGGPHVVGSDPSPEPPKAA